MLRFRTNTAKIIDNIKHKLILLGDTDSMTREMATTTTALVRNRIHEQGLAADGSAIGTYSKEYMKVRTGNYSNSGVVSRGKNEGKKKDSGVFTKGAFKGQQRPRYNRTADTTVVLSLTRQMENDLGVCATDPIQIKGGYGVGFQNAENYKKARYLEDTYKKKIFSLSNAEKDIITQIAKKHIKDAIS